ncbi:MAG TPA: polysaccharide biosynthesis/export family protein [Burkholderiales bacterium]|nr:polysaccharide biosynthesis/export family protein [Burkholderiales bacterium]
MIRIAVLFLMMVVSAGAAAQALKLGPGDTVHVTVFGQPDLTTDARLSERGAIDMPLLGAIGIGGKTPGAAANAIAAALKKGEILKNPQVTVALTTVRSRQVSVLGLIAHPGRYPLEEAHLKLPDIIAAAGGFAPGGGNAVTVIRNGEAKQVSALDKDFELKGGDTVYVDRAPVFYIYGEVTHSGAYPVTPNLTVMQAISIGGGITPRGSDRRVKLRRTGRDGKVVETDAGLQDLVKADDVIYVKESIF